MTITYLHIWENEEGKYTAESGLVYSLDESKKQYHQDTHTKNSYVHTLVLDDKYDNFSTINIVEIMVEEGLAEALQKREDRCDYERITGHEMDVARGRI